MIVAKHIAQVRSQVDEARAREEPIRLVPTMGALHEGHRSLIRAARADGGFVVVSIFVNPTQFGPNEDLTRYPRPIEADLAACEEEGVDLVFHPPTGEMYPEEPKTTVHVADLTEGLCGAYRPGHFDGVCTVATKLLGIVRPDAAYFGEKDAQQLAVLRRMVADLNLPVRIRACPLVRDADTLATSSRNAYLSDEQRARALALPQAVLEAGGRIRAGERDAAAVERRVQEALEAAEGVEPQYVAVVDPDTMEPLETIGEQVLVAAAVQVGRTRLIDNVLLRNLDDGGEG
ncbi:MAG: pantoate--beta-alanine ligase [Phycisphaerae bacterium]